MTKSSAGTVERPTDSAQYLSIGDAAERTGLTQRTLRYYEELGLLKPPARVARGQRLYGPDDLARVAQVRRMKELLGFSLTEIGEVLEAEDAKQHLRDDAKRERSPKRRLRQLRDAVAITARQLEIVEHKLSQMQAMKRELARDRTNFEERLAQLELLEVEDNR